MVNSHIVPIVGRICMDQLSIDITDVQGVSTGDIVTLIGAEEYDDLSASSVAYSSLLIVPKLYATEEADKSSYSSVAYSLGTISNELLCRMGARLPVIIKSDALEVNSL